jgi:hypothetical protein
MFAPRAVQRDLALNASKLALEIRETCPIPLSLFLLHDGRRPSQRPCRALLQSTEAEKAAVSLVSSAASARIPTPKRKSASNMAVPTYTVA